MKRLLCLCLCALMLTGCVKQPEKKQGYVAFATFYPVYAIAANILSGVEGADVRLLVQPQDGCLRTYSLSDWDATLLQSADLVILGGGELEGFEADLTTLYPKAAIANLTLNIPLINHDRDHEHTENEDVRAHYDEANPHVYMSVSGAIELSRAMLSYIVQGDSEYSAQYTANQAAFDKRLIALSAQIDGILADTPRAKTALMSEALMYVARDCDIDITTVIYREPGQEVLYEDLDGTLTQLREAEIRLILIESHAPQAFVDKLKAAGYSVALLDVMSTHTTSEGLGAYEEILLNNAQVLADALQYTIQ